MTRLPPSSERIANGGLSEYQGFLCPGLRLTGVQFHAEMTKEGSEGRPSADSVPQIAEGIEPNSCVDER